MRYALENTRQLSLSPNSGTTSLKPVAGRGPKGEDGSNVLPTDEAIAAAIENPASDTASALSASYAARLEPASYTYNSDGSVASETVGGMTTAYAYNGDGTVHTATRDGVTLTYSYNADGTVSGVA